MAFKSKSQRPTRTPEELVKLEEDFISGAKADVAEASKPQEAASSLALKSEVSIEQTEDAQEPSLDQNIASDIQETPTAEVAQKKIDPYTLVKRVAWPITYERQSPILTEGRNDIDKPFIMRLKEDLWNSVELHCEALCIPKSEWVREAIRRQLYEEQMFFLSNKK